MGLKKTGMDLFQSQEEVEGRPLAYRMRPRVLDEYVGQDHIVGPGRLLRRMIQADQLSSLLFYGPPGTGKTTLARVIANTTESSFITMNAVLSGVKDLRSAISQAHEKRDLYSVRTILFIDEVHRWNKAQQDALLPWVENGTVILIGATTQNPYFEVISALVSRSTIFQLKPLLANDLHAIAKTAIEDADRGYGKFRVSVDRDAIDHLVNISAGDARSLLNAIELAVETTPGIFPPEENSEIHITRTIAEESIQRKVVLYDKEGDYHFDAISAFIKSLRGSDPDAALYWMAKMVHAGEDPHYIFRRMLILAAEDVGLADPQALVVVASAAATFDRVGMPEGQFHLSEAALYLATAPKSNTTLAFFDAISAIEEEEAQEVPSHLRDTNRDKEGFGHGEGYLYPHAYRDHWVAQQYLPSGLQGRVFYEPSDQGYEGGVKDAVLRRREAQIAAMLPDDNQEVLTFTPIDKDRERWIERITSRKGELLTTIRDEVFLNLSIRRHHRILDLNGSTGILLWEAFRRAPEGGIWSIVPKGEWLEVLRHQALAIDAVRRPTIFESDLHDALLDLHGDRLRFEAIVGYNALLRSENKTLGFSQLVGLLAPNGKLSIAETVPQAGQRLSEFLTEDDMDAGLLATCRIAEDELYAGENGGLTGWDVDTLTQNCVRAGFSEVNSYTRVYMETRTVGTGDLDSWFTIQPGKMTYGSALEKHLGQDQIKSIFKAIAGKIADIEVPWKRTVAFLSAVL